jgi:predicted AlkP superfamily pyrophosphatase or phosphodiesterase
MKRPSTARTALLAAALTLTAASAAQAVPKVVLISLDSANPAVVEQYLTNGVINPRTGLGILKSRGSRALQNDTIFPSLTAAAHIGIATGSTAIHNDIPANGFKLLVSPTSSTVSGFGAPIGGYQISPLGPTSSPTAVPLWVTLRNAGKSVVTATWPGGDGVDVTAPGVTNSPVIQANTPTRTVNYTVPFGAFGGIGARAFSLSATNFGPASPTVTSQLAAAGRVSYSPVQQTTAPIETVFCSPTTTGNCGTTNAQGRTLQYDILVAALDTTNDNTVNYDTLVFFDQTRGIQPGPFALPATGPAYVRVGGRNGQFFFEGSGNRIGTAFYITTLTPNLSAVRFIRYSANFIPRNTPVLADVDDINSNVGFWAPQPDFRIPQRDPGFTGNAAFSDLELETAYSDLVSTFVDYQTRVCLRGIQRVPNADLVMCYIEQPDGAGHQYTLTDPRQATNPADPTSIGTPGTPAGATGQDQAKVNRYNTYRQFSYQIANNSVQAIIKAVGRDSVGTPKSNILVVSDHGMSPFHTSVSINNILTNAGISTAQANLRVVTSGPAANIYINLAGREQGGTVSTDDYQARVAQIAAALSAAVDTNPFYINPANPQPGSKPIFKTVIARPTTCANVGFCPDPNLGQDYGDVFAVMDLGYNFDGFQASVGRLGDAAPPAGQSRFLSVPTFYGAHGFDSTLPEMSAVLYAAGPNIRQGVALDRVGNIDIAPTILQILGVSPAPTVDGTALTGIVQP